MKFGLFTMATKEKQIIYIDALSKLWIISKQDVYSSDIVIDNHKEIQRPMNRSLLMIEVL